jgi:hypothetical protein
MSAAAVLPTLRQSFSERPEWRGGSREEGVS